MKANEFVKNKGLRSAKLIVDCWIDYPETDVYLPDMMEYTFIAIKPTESCPFVSIDDLKRLIESHELVEKFGGLYNSKGLVGHFKFIDCSHIVPDGLEQAIADVESCQ